MTKFVMPIVLAIPMLCSSPDAQGPAGAEYWSNTWFAQIRAKMDSTANKSSYHFASERLADYPNDAVLLFSPRKADGPPDDKRGGTIEGGTRQKISAGDIIRIPARTPHQLFLDGTKELDYVVIKVKGH
jgi:hypothetical protein